MVHLVVAVVQHPVLEDPVTQDPRMVLCSGSMHMDLGQEHQVLSMRIFLQVHLMQTGSRNHAFQWWQVQVKHAPLNHS